MFTSILALIKSKGLLIVSVAIAVIVAGLFAGLTYYKSKSSTLEENLSIERKNLDTMTENLDDCKKNIGHTAEHYIRTDKITQATEATEKKIDSLTICKEGCGDESNKDIIDIANGIYARFNAGLLVDEGANKK